MSRGVPFGFGPRPVFPAQDDPHLGPEMLALLRQSRGVDPGPDDVPSAVPPGFTAFAPASPPTGTPTPVVDTSGVRSLGGVAADAGHGIADMGRRTADLLGRLRSGEIDPNSFAKAAGFHLAGQAVETARSAATAPRDAWTGDLQIFDPATGHVSDEAINRSSGLAGLAMTGSLPFSAPAGALRTFGGRAAATADHAALDRATAMQAGGASPEAIWGSTGWGLGKDGVARFEIPDNGARLRPHDGSGSTTLDRVLDHPALFEAYPQMRDVQVFHRPELGSDAAANPSKNWIAANLDDAQALPALLHESQHIVQRAEGFAPGASPIDPALAAHPQVAEVAALRQRLTGLANPQAEALASRADQVARMEAYRTAAGEVEARNVEARQGMTPAERAATPPWRTQDIPADRQWLPRSGGVTGDAAQLRIPRGEAFYSGGPAGAAIGAATSILGDPADAQAASPSTASPKGSAMTFGIPFGFGSMPIPNANPDDAQRLLQRLPFDPSQAPNVVPTGDLSGPAGALVHHPNWKTLGQQAAQDGAIAMDEATTQRMEQQSGMMPGQDAPGAPRSPMPSPGDLARLFDQHPMGAPQGFAGTSGTIVPGAPGQAPSPGQTPAPGLGMPGASAGTPPRRIFGALAMPGGDDTADVPATGSVQASGQVSPGLPRGPSASPNGAPQAAPPVAGQAFGGPAQASAGSTPTASNASAPQSGGGFDLGGALDRFGRNGGYDTLTNLGIGLMSARGLGPGLAAGMKLDQDASAKRAVTDLARAEFGLKSQKLNQEALGQNATYNWLVSKGKSSEDAKAAVLGSVSGRPELLQSFIAELSPKTEIPSGYRRTDGGALEAIPGGPQDLPTIKAQAEARQEDKTVTPLTDPDARAKAGIPQGDTRSAWIDTNGKVTFDAGQTPRLITVKGANGETVTKRYNPATGQAEEIPGAAPPAVDTTGIPPGVDPATYRKELAKATVSEQKGATQRAQQAHSAIPILDRAEQAYSRLSQNGGIGPYQASGFNRAIGGALGKQNEIDRQDYEAAAKDLELLKAQISMKGQGAISDSERRLLGYTLPRLDAASAETGLTTLRGIRDQFGRTISTDGLPTRQGQGQAPGQSTGAAIQIPGQAVQALQRDPNLRAQFEAKYGQGSAARFLGGR